MKNQDSTKLAELLKTDNRFVFGEVNFIDSTFVVDSIWKGFAQKRELRGPRTGPLPEPDELKKWEDYAGVNAIVFDAESSIPWLDNGGGRAIFHVSFLKQFFPKMLETSSCLESLEYGGFAEENTELGKKLARKHLSPKERNKVREEYGNKCYICKSTQDLTIHHIRDRKSGGGTEIRNSVLLCHLCHSKVHNEVIDRSTVELLRYRYGYANLREHKKLLTKK